MTIDFDNYLRLIERVNYNHCTRSIDSLERQTVYEPVSYDKAEEKRLTVGQTMRKVENVFCYHSLLKTENRRTLFIDESQPNK